MDIDPIDDGPTTDRGSGVVGGGGGNSGMGGGGKPPSSSSGGGGGIIPMQISEEEEARQAIDMLRGDDVSARVAAASKLGAVASVLGEERTREVREK